MLEIKVNEQGYSNKNADCEESEYTLSKTILHEFEETWSPNYKLQVSYDSKYLCRLF